MGLFDNSSGGSGGGGLFGGGGPAGTLSTLTPGQIANLGTQVSSADPSLFQQAQNAIKTPVSLVGQLLHLVSLPGQFIRQETLSAPSGSAYLANQGDLPGGSTIHQLVRGLKSFALDTATDPLTYLSGGTEGVAANAAKETLLSTGLEAVDKVAPMGLGAAKAAAAEAGTPFSHAAFALAQPEGSAARALGEAIHSTPSFAKALQNAAPILAQYRVKAADILPHTLQGGLKFQVPFLKATQKTLIPAEVTGKLTAPLGEAIKGSGPYEGLAKLFSSSAADMQAARAAGPAAALQAAAGLSVKSNALAASKSLVDEGQALAKQMYNAFGADKKGVALMHEAVLAHLNEPNDLAGALQNAGRTELSQAQQAVLPKYRAAQETLHAYQVSHGLLEEGQKLPNYYARQNTQAALEATRNGATKNAVSRVSPSAAPSSAFARSEALRNLPFKEAQAAKSAELGVEKAYIENPAQTLVNASKDIAKKGALAQAREGLAAAGAVTKDSAQKQVLPGLTKDTLAKAGLTLDQARTMHLLGDVVTPEHPTGILNETGLLKPLQAQKALDNATTAAKLPKATAQAARSASGLHTLAGSLANKEQELANARLANKVGDAGNRIQKAVEELAVTRKALARQQDLADASHLKATNLSAGFNSAGDHWPVPKLAAEALQPGWKPFSKDAPGIFAGHSAPSWIVDNFEKTLTQAQQPEIAKQLDVVTNAFKHWTTSLAVNPPFALKRLSGRVVIDHVLGASPYEIGATRLAHALYTGGADALPAAEKVARQISTRSGTVVTGQQLLDHVQQQSIIKGGVTEAGDIAGNVGKLGNENLSRLHQPGFGVKPLAAVTTTADRFTSRLLGEADAGGRLAVFAKGLEMSGGNPEAARMLTMQGYGNFGELTPFEQTVMKRVIPFYTWLRVKAPLITQSLVQHPGTVINPQRAFNEVLGNQQQTDALMANGEFPKSQEAKGGVVAGGLLQGVFNHLGATNPVAVSFDNPLFSLNSLASTSGLLGEAHPALKAVGDILYHSSVYPGQVQPMKYMQHVTGPTALVGNALAHVPFLSTLVARTNGGELRMDSQLANLLQSLPISQLTTLAGTIPGIGAHGPAAIKYLLPVTATEITPQSVQGSLAGEQGALKGLRNEALAEVGKPAVSAAIKAHPGTTKVPRIPGIKSPSLPHQRKVTF